jgi:hypothetical protein
VPRHDLRVLYGKGAQTLRVVPVDQQGRPRVASAATYGIVDLRRSETDTEREIVAAGTAGTLDGVSTTTAAAAGFGTANPSKVALASTVGIEVGRHYLLRAAAGGEELVTVEEIGTGFVITGEIAKTFASGSAFLGIEVAATFPADEANDEDEVQNGGGPYALDMIFTGCTPQHQRFLVWLDRTTFRVPATIDDVLELEQTLASGAGRRVKIERALSRAAKDMQTELQLAGIDATRYLLGEVGRDYCVYRAAALVLETLPSEGASARATKHSERAAHLIATIIQGKPDGVASPRRSDDTADPGRSMEARGLFRRT